MTTQNDINLDTFSSLVILASPGTEIGFKEIGDLAAYRASREVKFSRKICKHCSMAMYADAVRREEIKAQESIINDIVAICHRGLFRFKPSIGFDCIMITEKGLKIMQALSGEYMPGRNH